ncbi:hypothetical protein HDU91_005463 [Kappamyces sp. JEL0680]|nr:hypothetical protein HDU91_005463 [Kappamyces sp. JEL0680]
MSGERKPSSPVILSLPTLPTWLPAATIDIAEHLDSSASEVALARKGRRLTIQKLLKRDEGQSFDDYREAYLLLRQQERQPETRNQTLQRFWNHSFHKFKRQVRSSVWILNLYQLSLDFLFCVFYLSEIQTNVTNPCNPSLGCGRSEGLASWLPSWATVNRLPEAFRILVGLSILKLIGLGIAGLIFVESTWTHYLKEPYPLTSLCITLPFLVLSPVRGSKFIYIPYFISIFALLMSLRSLVRLRKRWTPFNLTDFGEKLIMLLAYLLTLLYVGMCIFNFFETRFTTIVREPTNSNLSLVDTFYFIVITFSTVGYGDITPHTVPGQFTIIILIFVALAIVPSLVNDVLETIKAQSQGAGSFKRTVNPYVVLCGDFCESRRALDMIHSLLRRDARGELGTVVVLLARTNLPNELKLALKSHRLRGRVVFVQGSGLDHSDLERVQLDHAKAAFILAKSRAPEIRLEDEANTLRALAFDRFAPNTPIFLETRLPQTASLHEESTSGVVCISEFRQIFLAYTCLYKGFATVLLNLLRGSNSYSAFHDPWHAQYSDGATNELYRFPINPVFHGQSFAAASFYLYRHYQVVLFALHVYIEDKDAHHVVLNPGNSYLIKPRDYGFFISPSRNMGKKLMQLVPGCNLADEEKRLNFVVGHPKIELDGKVPLCILNPSPARLSESLLTDAALLVNHFLVCTKDFELFRFVCTLRSAHLQPEEIVPILLLCPRPPTDEEFARFERFPKLYFMVGDPIKAQTIRNAGVFKASRVVLANMANSSAVADGSDNYALEDSTTIMISNMIERMFRDIGISNCPVVSLSDRANMKFLAPFSSSHIPRRKRSKIHQMVKSEISADQHFCPMFASGNVVSPIMIEAVLANAFHTPSIINLFNCFAGVRYKIDTEIEATLHLEASNLSYVACPREFVGRPYGHLYQALSETLGIIPIGLLRDSLGSALKNPLPFVYTNPLWSVLLHETDMVYILATRSSLSQ